MIRKLFDKDSLLLVAFQDELFHWVIETNSDSIRRNLLPVVSSLLSKDYIENDGLVARLYVKCLDWSNSQQYAIAVRFNAMEFMTALAGFEPGLSHELLPFFEMIHQYAEGGVKARSRILIDKMKSLVYAEGRKE